jgi:hypothetical protein
MFQTFRGTKYTWDQVPGTFKVTEYLTRTLKINAEQHNYDNPIKFILDFELALNKHPGLRRAHSALFKKTLPYLIYLKNMYPIKSVVVFYLGQSVMTIKRVISLYIINAELWRCCQCDMIAKGGYVSRVGGSSSEGEASTTGILCFIVLVAVWPTVEKRLQGNKTRRVYEILQRFVHSLLLGIQTGVHLVTHKCEYGAIC